MTHPTGNQVITTFDAHGNAVRVDRIDLVPDLTGAVTGQEGLRFPWLARDGPDLIGILTERDVLVRVVGERRDPAALRVGAVMTTAVVTIALDAAVEEAMAVMTASRCRHLPVMDGGVSLGWCPRAT